jgi:poly(3-hydroxybutyrate) depolymerase
MRGDRPSIGLVLLLLLALLTAAGGCDVGGEPPLTDASVADGLAPDSLRPDTLLPPDTVSPYPADPFKGLNKVGSDPDIYWGTSSFGDKQGQLIVWAPPGYTADRAWPLVVYLHGGGNTTDNKQSQVTGYSRLKSLVPLSGSDRFIWLAAVIRTPGSYHAWVVKQNLLDMLDAVREVSRRFHVDPRRVYLNGTSMGGGGVASISWLLPRAFAAFGPAAGYYWNSWCKVPDLKGVHYRVVHGALDKVPEQPFDRLKLAEAFVKLCQGAGATVEKVILPGVGHAYPSTEVPKMSTFFLKHSSTAATDWTAVRKKIEQSSL